MERPNDPLQLPEPTRNTCKIANKLMTIASGEINLQKKNLTCHVAKVKAATSAHSMADVIPFFIEFNIPFESNALKKPKEKYMLFTTKKTLSVTFPLHHCSNSFWQTRSCYSNLKPRLYYWLINSFLSQKSRLNLICLHYE